MTILTLGASPYCLYRNGRINRELLHSLKASGHRIGGLVWNHDVDFFRPNEIGVHNFYYEKQDICRLFPFVKQKGELAAFTIEVMKSAQPNVVVSVCDYSELPFLAVIKSKYRKLFKWVAIIPCGSSTVNELYRPDLEMADAIITTTQVAYQHMSQSIRTDVHYVPFGPDLGIFSQTGTLDNDFSVIYPCRNDQMSNPGAFIQAAANSGVKMGLHYNHSDKGDFDIPLLIRRHGLHKVAQLPQKYVSFREGLEDLEMNQEYNRYHAVVDCSSQSATGLSVLEAMATGCIPIGMEHGAVGEIIRQLPEEFRFFAPFEILTGPREEEHAVVSIKGLTAILEKMKAKHKDQKWLMEARDASKDIAAFFSKDKFSQRVNEIIEDVVYKEHAIVVDSF